MVGILGIVLLLVGGWMWLREDSDSVAKELYTRAEIQLSSHQYAAAEGTINEAILLSPENPAYRDFKKSIGIHKQCHEFFVKAKNAFHRGNYASSARWLESALMLEKAPPEYLQLKALVDEELAKQSQEEDIQAEEHEETAHQEVEKQETERLEAERREAEKREAKEMFVHAKKAMEAEDYVETVRILQEVLKKDPENVVFQKFLSRAQAAVEATTAVSML